MADKEKTETKKVETLYAVSDITGFYNGRPWVIKKGKPIVGDALKWINVEDSLKSGIIKKG